MREILVSILPEFPKFPDNLPTLPKIPEDVPIISEDCRSSNFRRDLINLLLRTQTRHFTPFPGLFWVEIEFNFSRQWLMNK